MVTHDFLSHIDIMSGKIIQYYNIRLHKWFSLTWLNPNATQKYCLTQTIVLLVPTMTVVSMSCPVSSTFSTFMLRNHCLYFTEKIRSAKWNLLILCAYPHVNILLAPEFNPISFNFVLIEAMSLLLQLILPYQFRTLTPKFQRKLLFSSSTLVAVTSQACIW